MFTVGIFSTHLPYLAFVFFYAWFMLFGVQKASGGELPSVEKSCYSETHSVHQSITFLADQNFHYAHFNVALNSPYNKTIQVKKKIKQGCFSATKINPVFSSFSLLNRPPPVR